MNELQNRLNNNLMDLFINNIINNNPILSNINNSNLNEINFGKNINYFDFLNKNNFKYGKK